MYQILRAILFLLTMWFDGLTDGAFSVDDYPSSGDLVSKDYIDKLDRDNKREIRTFDKDGIVGVTIVTNSSTIQVHGYLLCSEYELKNATFPSCQHVLIGASFVLLPQLQSIKVCLKGNPFSKACQNFDNIRYVDVDDFGFIHPRYEPQYRIGDVAVLRLDDGLNSPLDNPKKWVYPTNNLMLQDVPEEYYGFVTNRRGVTRWKESMAERNTSLMDPFKDKHPYPVLDVCKNVSNAPRYYFGNELGPWRSLNTSWRYDFAPIGPHTCYTFGAVIMYDNRRNLFPDHGLLINIERNTVLGIYSFENPLLWDGSRAMTTPKDSTVIMVPQHSWARLKNRPLLQPARNFDPRLFVQHFSIVSYYLPWIYFVVKTDTEDLMMGDTDEEATTSSTGSSTDDGTTEITTPIPEMPDIYYESDRAFDGIVYDVNPCGKAVSHLQSPWALWITAVCCSTRIPTAWACGRWF